VPELSNFKYFKIFYR